MLRVIEQGLAMTRQRLEGLPKSFGLRVRVGSKGQGLGQLQGPLQPGLEVLRLWAPASQVFLPKCRLLFSLGSLRA